MKVRRIAVEEKKKSFCYSAESAEHRETTRTHTNDDFPCFPNSDCDVLGWIWHLLGETSIEPSFVITKAKDTGQWASKVHGQLAWTACKMSNDLQSEIELLKKKIT